jgi:hypothetical protein
VWSIDLWKHVSVAVHELVTFLGSNDVIWIVPMVYSDKSQDCSALTHLLAVSKLQHWQLTIWHSRFEFWPPRKFNNLILEIDLCMAEKHSNGFTSNVNIEIVKSIIDLIIRFGNFVEHLSRFLTIVFLGQVFFKTWKFCNSKSVVLQKWKFGEEAWVNKMHN